MVQTVKRTFENEAVETTDTQKSSIWLSALFVGFGWLISNIVVFLVSDWFISGTASVEFEPRLGAALLLGVLGLLAGFTLSVVLWLTQENFIGVHAVAYTVIITLLTAVMSYIPDGILVLPILFMGLYIGMKWANPEMNISHITASFLVWMAVAIIMILVLLALPYTGENALLELLWQGVWSGSVGFFGSAFMFWQLSQPVVEFVPPLPDEKNENRDAWEQVYHAL